MDFFLWLRAMWPEEKRFTRGKRSSEDIDLACCLWSCNKCLPNWFFSLQLSLSTVEASASTTSDACLMSVFTTTGVEKPLLESSSVVYVSLVLG